MATFSFLGPFYSGSGCLVPSKSEATGFLPKFGDPYYQEMMLLQSSVGGNSSRMVCEQEESCLSFFCLWVLFPFNKVQCPLVLRSVSSNERKRGYWLQSISFYLSSQLCLNFVAYTQFPLVSSQSVVQSFIIPIPFSSILFCSFLSFLKI